MNNTVFSKRDIKHLKRKSIGDIVETIGMANLPLIVGVLHKKYHGRVKLFPYDGDCVIRYGHEDVARMSYLATHLHFLEIKKNKLIITGNISLPAAFQKRCRFYALINGKEKKCQFFDAGLDQAIGEWIYETRTAFHLTIDLDVLKESNSATRVVFAVETDGIKSILGKIDSLRFMEIADVLPKQYAYISGWIFKIENGMLIINQSVDSSVEKCEKEFQDASLQSVEPQSSDMSREEVEYAINLRKEFFREKEKKKKPIWLFFDRFDKADDNGEIMFHYMNSHFPDYAEYYYVIDKDCPDFIRLEKTGKVIPALSYEHKFLLLMADYILTSQMNGFVENPYGNCAEYFRDLYHRPKVIFLQHGVTKDDQTPFLGIIKQNLYAIITSSHLEKEEFLRKPYGFSESQVWLTGMPRFDRLYHNEKRQILIIPTWRQSEMHLAYDKNRKKSFWSANPGIDNSNYIKKYRDLLNSSKLRALCTKYKYNVVFAPHPLMRPYLELFMVPEWISTFSGKRRYRDVFAESNLMITDFSSVAFDYALLNKPIIYYQFDENRFFEDHTYKKGYFDYRKNGFGEVAIKEKEVLVLLESYLSSDCQIKEQYKERRKEFFAFGDAGNCERVYKKITENSLHELQKGD